jgi:hypothetical protein
MSDSSSPLDPHLGITDRTLPEVRRPVVLPGDMALHRPLAKPKGLETDFVVLELTARRAEDHVRMLYLERLLTLVAESVHGSSLSQCSNLQRDPTGLFCPYSPESLWVPGMTGLLL